MAAQLKIFCNLMLFTLAGCSTFPAKPPIIAAPQVRTPLSTVEIEQSRNLKTLLDQHSLRFECRVIKEFAAEEKEEDLILNREILNATQCHGYGAEFRFSPEKDCVIIYEPFPRATANPDQQPRNGGFLVFAKQVDGRWAKRAQVPLPPHQGFRLEEWTPSQRFCVACISYPKQRDSYWHLLTQAGYCPLVIDFETGIIYQLDDETWSYRERPVLVDLASKESVTR